jgi:hypothetical protein
VHLHGKPPAVQCRLCLRVSDRQKRGALEARAGGLEERGRQAIDSGATDAVVEHGHVVAQIFSADHPRQGTVAPEQATARAVHNTGPDQPGRDLGRQAAARPGQPEPGVEPARRQHLAPRYDRRAPRRQSLLAQLGERSGQHPAAGSQIGRPQRVAAVVGVDPAPAQLVLHDVRKQQVAVVEPVEGSDQRHPSSHRAASAGSRAAPG